jgi:DNA modification methylase
MIALANIKKLPIADNSIDMIWTDPPYPKDFLECYGWLANESLRVLKPGGFVFTMAGGYFLNKIFSMFESVSGLNYFWEFHHRSNGDAPYIWPRYVLAKTKVIIAYCKGAGLPRIKSVLSMFESTEKSKNFHHWGQDVGSARYYIDCFSKENDLILDPFIGGGTTAIACSLIGRRCLSFDIDIDSLKTTQDRISNGDVMRNLPMFNKIDVTDS